jgi:hypothetical protein
VRFNVFRGFCGSAVLAWCKYATVPSSVQTYLLIFPHVLPCFCITSFLICFVRLDLNLPAGNVHVCFLFITLFGLMFLFILETCHFHFLLFFHGIIFKCHLTSFICHSASFLVFLLFFLKISSELLFIYEYFTFPTATFLLQIRIWASNNF